MGRWLLSLLFTASWHARTSRVSGQDFQKQVVWLLSLLFTASCHRRTRRLSDQVALSLPRIAARQGHCVGKWLLPLLFTASWHRRTRLVSGQELQMQAVHCSVAACCLSPRGWPKSLPPIISCHGRTGCQHRNEWSEATTSPDRLFDAQTMLVVAACSWVAVVDACHWHQVKGPRLASLLRSVIQRRRLPFHFPLSRVIFHFFMSLFEPKKGTWKASSLSPFSSSLPKLTMSTATLFFFSFFAIFTSLSCTKAAGVAKVRQAAESSKGHSGLCGLRWWIPRRLALLRNHLLHEGNSHQRRWRQ